MDDKIRIKCPHCKSVLKINKQFNLENKSITCPLCGTQKLFSEYELLDSAKPAGKNTNDTDYKKENNDTVGSWEHENDTTIETKTGIGKLICNGKAIELMEGKNIVGRKSDTSQSTIQIDDPTNKMSREHLVINVCRLKNGTYIYQAELYKIKVNTTLINGEKLNYGDIMKLTEGDTITLPNNIKLKFTTK